MTDTVQNVISFARTGIAGPLLIPEGQHRPADDPLVLHSPDFWVPLDATPEEIEAAREKVLNR